MIIDLIAGAGVALICTLLACWAMIGAPIVDMPGEARKLHVAPTPTSGGVGISVGVAFGFVALALFSSEWRHAVSARGFSMATMGAAFAYGFLVLGFVDDARPLGPRLKLLIFVCLSLGAAFAIGLVRTLDLGLVTIDLPLPIAAIGTALWVFTMVNCVNFMDGANGLAMGSMAIGLAVLAGLGLSLHEFSAAGFAASAAGAALGFLFWNFPGGRIFAGDSGALFMGAVGALVSLILCSAGGMSPFAPPILFFPLLSDALLTLAWRAGRGRSLLDGHSEHLYQIAQRAGWGRRRIALIYWAAMAVCAAIAVAAVFYRDFGPYALGLLALAAVLIAARVRSAAMRAGIAEI
ncbi:MAG TPA: hypothetical protein PKY87_02740 [Terricaulis sp.]|nr:hypothetical protein [Terricaulis sp.]